MPVVQPTLEDLGTPLREVTFVVVDLETTGGSAHESAITEIGAVKIRGGEELGRFQTLVNPGAPIPAFIQVLTGISDALVARAPRIDTVLPAFLEFARGSVLVAHNARFDIGFLKAAAAQAGHPWPGFRVVDTVILARHLVSSDEARNHKLSTLASLFSAATTPDHRALHDALATTDVLHALLGRVGNLGVTTLEELSSYTSRVTPAQRRKRFLADQLPAAPGVYVFRDGKGRTLYVGTSHNIRNRARSYFTASEQRTRMAEMVAAAESIHPIVCQTVLEAQVQEVRLLRAHKPPYNRRSTRPERAVWVKLTDEPFPRLSIVRELRTGAACYVGPFRSRTAAEAAVAAVHEAIPLRQCPTRLGKRPRGSACIVAELGRCGAPCEGRQSTDEYAGLVTQARELLTGNGHALFGRIADRMRELSAAHRYEEAATVRDRMEHLASGAARAQRLAPLAATAEVLAARRREEGGWEFACVRYGRLAGSATSPRGADPLPFVEALRATAEIVAAPDGPIPAAIPEETELVLRWLESPGVRIVHLDGTWTCPVGGAGRIREELRVARLGA